MCKSRHADRTTIEADAAEGPDRTANTKPDTSTTTVARQDSGKSVIATGSGIDPSVEKAVKKHAKLVQESLQKTLEEAWNLGGVLRKAKLQVTHGQWLPWLREVGLSPRTAQRCMKLHECYPEMRHVAHFGTITEALRILPAAKGLEAKSPRTDSGTTSSEAAEGELQPAGPPTRAETDGDGGGTAQTADDDLGRVVEQFERALGETARRTPTDSLSHLGGLFKMVQVMAVAIPRYLDGPAHDESKVAEVTDKLVAELEEAVATLRKRRSAARMGGGSRVDHG